MSIPTEVIMRMATLGLSEEQAKAVADMLTAVEAATEKASEDRISATVEAGREKARARWHRWDEKRRSNVGKRLPTAANVSKQLAGADAPVEDKTSNLEIEPQSKTERKIGDLAEFRAHLAPLVSAVELEEFIKVRKRKRGGLTGYAARLFVADAERCGMTPQQAATECIRSSWITVKPEYFPNRPRAGPAPKPNPGLAAVDALMEKIDAVSTGEAQGHPPYPRLVAVTGSG